MIIFFLLFELFVITKHEPESCPNNLKRLECGSSRPHVCADGPRPPTTFKCVKNVCGCEPFQVLHNNTCIPYSECPNICDKNSTYTDCDTACPKKCSDYPFKPKRCTRQCISNSCACNDGYVLNATKKCIRLEDCPEYIALLPKTTTTTKKPKKSKCKRNMFYSSCPNPKEVICLSSKNQSKKKCGRPKCICKKGYAKYKNKCIHMWECNIFPTMIFLFFLFPLVLTAKLKKKKCPNNLVLLHCGSRRPHKCSDGPNPPRTLECVRNVCGCVYPDVLHKKRCIPHYYCPRKCDRNSTYTNCDTACPLKCSDYPFKPKPCTRQCVLNSCACKDGYVLNDKNKCILKKDCPEYPSRPPKKPRCKDRRKVFSECPKKEEDRCFSSKLSSKECGNPRCICKEGYARYQKKCIRLSRCKYISAKRLKEDLLRNPPKKRKKFPFY
uniref:EGF-like domain-containing protein n=1 Tax=Strongyloides stercoralis TaxID=6248 RepID=A0A0K0EAF6_STRER